MNKETPKIVCQVIEGTYYLAINGNSERDWEIWYSKDGRSWEGGRYETSPLAGIMQTHAHRITEEVLRLRHEENPLAALREIKSGN